MVWEGGAARLPPIPIRRRRGHQTAEAQSTIRQGAKEAGPKNLCFGQARRDAQNLALAVLVQRHGDYHGTADDSSAITDLDVGGVQPETGPTLFQRAREEGLHADVDLAAKPADPALGHAACAHQ